MFFSYDSLEIAIFGTILAVYVSGNKYLKGDE